MSDLHAADPRPRRWDLFCRRVDNFGDVGVSWRVATGLALRGDAVRLWLDDASPLRFMAPDGAAGVTVLPWPSETGPFPGGDTGDVVVETFGCTLPAPVVAAMRRRAVPPVWLNLEYLSAEPFVERSHGLPSPQADGLRKWFFFPGFTPATGGLACEPGLAERRRRFDRDAWLASLGLPRRPDERVALLFCYANPQLPALLRALGDRPTLLLLTPGPAQDQVRAQAATLPPNLRPAELPWLSQTSFDHALWSSDLSLVRGEDSWVRALWAGSPFLWQPYPQEAEFRSLKLEAWLSRLCEGARDPSLQAMLRAAQRRIDGLDGLPADAPLVLPDHRAWAEQVQDCARRVQSGGDLIDRLRRFAAAKS